MHQSVYLSFDIEDFGLLNIAILVNNSFHNIDKVLESFVFNKFDQPSLF